LGFRRIAIDPAFGITSRINSSRFHSSSTLSRLTPVALPFGRAKLSTSPTLTGSSATPNTIGIVEVAAFAASAAGMPPIATITATWRSTRSAAIAGSRSYCPSAQRYSIATFCPSV
jgi:hypothetical protein